MKCSRAKKISLTHKNLYRLYRSDKKKQKFVLVRITRQLQARAEYIQNYVREIRQLQKIRNSSENCWTRLGEQKEVNF